MNAAAGTEYNLRLRALPSEVPEVIRLRRLLKAALRVYEFRCVEVTVARRDLKSKVSAHLVE